MDFLLVMITGLVTGAAAASLVVLGWAASQRRWLAAHCYQEIAYWREEAERAKAIAARLRDQLAANWGNWPGHRTGTDE